MVPLYMDENVHGDITGGLRVRLVDVITAQEDNRAGAPDPDVLDRATVLGRVLFSQDRDLLAEAAGRQRSGRSFCGVVYARQTRVSLRDCIDGLELISKVG